MIRQALIVLSTITCLVGCNFSNQVKRTVETGVSNAKVEAESDLSLAKSNFDKSYSRFLKNSKDSIFSRKVIEFYSGVIKTSNYIDSLRTELNKFDDIDPKNVDLIEAMFIRDGLGDSVFRQVRQSYSMAIDIALADTTKSRLRNVRETYSDDAKKQFFGLNAPLGVSMILYGIESELIQDGIMCLAGDLRK